MAYYVYLLNLNDRHGYTMKTMKNAIIIHGRPNKQEYYDPNLPSESNAHWLPWLQSQLLKHNITAATPEIPNAYDCHWATWAREVERFDITPDTILIGHSAGGGFLVKYLSIHPELMVSKVILVAPWLDPMHEGTKNFFDDFDIDPGLSARTSGVTVFNSDNDQEDVHMSVAILKQSVSDIAIREFHNYGHFCYTDLQTIRFPELLEEALKT
jgi:predicted alpha/beta hydrolase family esterase